jgi:hypothetical protein
MGSINEIQQKNVDRKRRTPKLKKDDSELVKLFWLSPMEAYFDQFTIAPVIGRSPKTLECDRWKKSGIPFRKTEGKILYQKKNAIERLESHALVLSTSEYKVLDKVGR